jgi:hypothetical protein
MLIGEERLRAAIRSKFGSQATFAKAVGIPESNVTRGIKTQTPNFMQKCTDAGIDIDNLIARQRIENEENERKISKDEIIIELKKLIESQASLIKSYELLLKTKIEDI